MQSKPHSKPLARLAKFWLMWSIGGPFAFGVLLELANDFGYWPVYFVLLPAALVFLVCWTALGGAISIFFYLSARKGHFLPATLTYHDGSVIRLGDTVLLNSQAGTVTELMDACKPQKGEEATTQKGSFSIRTTDGNQQTFRVPPTALELVERS